MNEFGLHSVPLNQFRILRQIGLNSGVTHITQAQLGGRTGLSVGMINNYMKTLQAQKLIACERKSTKVVWYYLTNAGKEFLKEAKREIVRECRELIKDIEEPLRVFVFADGSLAANANPAVVRAGAVAVRDDSIGDPTGGFLS